MATLPCTKFGAAPLVCPDQPPERMIWRASTPVRAERQFSPLALVQIVMNGPFDGLTEKTCDDNGLGKTDFFVRLPSIF